MVSCRLGWKVPFISQNIEGWASISAVSCRLVDPLPRERGAWRRDHREVDCKAVSRPIFCCSLLLQQYLPFHGFLLANVHQVSFPFRPFLRLFCSDSYLCSCLVGSSHGCIVAKTLWPRSVSDALAAVRRELSGITST